MELISLLTTLFVTFAVSVVTQAVKKWKGLEGMGVQLVVLFLAIIISAFQFGWQYVPVQYAQVILTVLTGSIGWYELVIKQFEDKKTGV